MASPTPQEHISYQLIYSNSKGASIIDSSTDVAKLINKMKSMRREARLEAVTDSGRVQVGERWWCDDLSHAPYRPHWSYYYDGGLLEPSNV